MDFVIRELSQEEFDYHELHYTYSSNEHYVPSVKSEKDIFSCTFERKPLDKTYFHDSYDTLFQEYWQDVSAFGIKHPEKDEFIAYLEIAREEWNDRLRITNLLVAPEYRKNGIGTMLIEKAKEIARLEDRRVIVLETQSCNVPAIDFYLKNGFSFAGTNLYFYSNTDIEEDEVMIELVFLY